MAVAAVPLDPTELPDGTERVLLFRVAVDGSRRAASGLVGIFYRGDNMESLRAMQEHALAENGPGSYRVVVQRMMDGCWSYMMSTLIAVGDEVPPDPES